jgi:hypothetical protein
VAVAGAEGGLPLVACLDAEEVVGTPKVDLGEDLGASKAIEGFRDEREGVAIFYGDAVEASVVNAEAEGAVLFLHEQDRGATGRLRGSDEPLRKIFLDPCGELLELWFGEGVERAKRGFRAGLEVDGVVVRAMWGECVGSGLGEGLEEVVILRRNDIAEVLDVVRRVWERGRKLGEESRC